MRLAALYDIHGNLPALEAVVAEVRAAGVAAIVIGGDVLPGPMPRETLELLRALELPRHWLSGNGDRVVVEAHRGGDLTEVPAAYRDSIRWNAQQLTGEQLAFVASWPQTLVLDGVFFCHATPRNDREIFTRRTAEERLLPVFVGVEQPLAVCGHTHMQFDRRVGRLRVVNAGSVGMPFGEPGAYWLLLDGGVELRRTEYDLEAAAARVRASGYPKAEEFAERNILRPPSEEQILTAYAGAELR